MSERFRVLKFFDWKLFLAILGLIGFGLAAIYSTGQITALRQQLNALLAGLVIFFGLAFLNYEDLKKFAEPLYAIGIFLLIVVFNSGYEAMGAQRWLAIGKLSFQPSEFVKLSLIILLAKFLESNIKNLNSLIKSLPVFILIGIPFFIIFKQPDLGTALCLIVIFAAMLLWAGSGPERLLLLASPILSAVILHIIPLYPLWSWSIYLFLLVILLIMTKTNLLDSVIFFIMNVLAGLLSPLLWNNLELYQQKRILSFINPAIDPLARGVRYHMVKATIAVGSGGLFGKGFQHGPLTQLHYIPQQHTDFIFSVIAEEFGLIGSLIVIGLFAYIISRLITMALYNRSLFGTLIIMGTAALTLFQVVINIGMNMSIMPVVGIPLPFVSYGGSALVMFLAAFGIVESVIMRRSHLAF